jgi:hypothetical protein
MEASKHNARLFRNNRGLFLTLDGSRKVRAGLEADGASDLVGYKSIIITPDMVGKKIAVIAVAEVKRPGKYPSPEQKNFLRVVKESGGIAGVVRSAEDVRLLLTDSI